MDQLDAMNNARSILDNSVVEHKSKPPLRWIANLAGSIASKGILEISYMEDIGYTGFKYKYYGFLWDTFWPIYQKYGTFYKLTPYWENTGTVDPEFDPDLSCVCSNCDENEHCPGCVECESDFEDEETGDAFRIISDK